MSITKNGLSWLTRLRSRRRIKFYLLAWIIWLCVFFSPGLFAYCATPFTTQAAEQSLAQTVAQTVAQTGSQANSTSVQALEQQGRALYEAGRFTEQGYFICRDSLIC